MLIDDLITQGIHIFSYNFIFYQIKVIIYQSYLGASEPYRMFTSRSEFRVSYKGHILYSFEKFLIESKFLICFSKIAFQTAFYFFHNIDFVLIYILFQIKLSIRADNADLRLTEKGYEIGCVDESRHQQFINFKNKYEEGIHYLESIVFSASNWKSKVPQLPIHSNK